MYIDPMLRTVKDAPDCPTAAEDYPVFATVKSVQTFGGPAVVGSIRELLFRHTGGYRANKTE